MTALPGRPEPVTGGDEPTRLPDFLIIGAMRSGTTSLYRYLGAHPEVFMTPKELQFFTEHFSRGLDWYRRQFVTAGHRSVLGEATADYLARESAMQRIAHTLPTVKMIASLRNPVDRAWSHYGLLRARGRETRPFAEALEDELTAFSRDGSGASGVFYLVHGLYDVHLARLQQYFAPEQIHVSIFERMTSDPHATYRDLCTFLEIDASFVPENLGSPVNRYVTFRSLALRRLSHRLPGALGKAVARLNTRTQAPAPALEPVTRRRLEEFYAPHIARTEHLLGYDVPEWKPLHV